ncbi:MAG: hypothetical protein JW732_01040 [Dehalococcoidia bacterium]|nr:hypothetical protein [Dehalococcoidia bacterium]
MPRGFESHPLRHMDKGQAMAKEKAGKVLTSIGLALEVIGPAMTIHHRISYGRWGDGKDPCHGRAGLVLAGIGIPLLIAGNELNRKENKQVN